MIAEMQYVRESTEAIQERKFGGAFPAIKTMTILPRQ